MAKVRDGITLGAQIGLAAATSTEPVSAGVAAAASWLTPHILSIYDANAAWRQEAQELWIDILAESEDKRRDQYKATEDEFHRQKLIIEWLQEELEKVSGRVDFLEAKARNLLEQSESLIRARPDPKMRAYLTTACKNAVRRPDVFTPTWVRRFFEKLGNMGAEHLDMLCRIVFVTPGRRDERSVRINAAMGSPHGRFIFDELVSFDLILGPPAGIPLSASDPPFRVSYLGHKLAQFVSLSQS